MLRKQLTAVLLLFVAMFMFAGVKSEARVVFRSNGGHWSHHHRNHPGWHRYWGGPTIGFYWAAAPVFIVAGYPAATYYTGPTFWTSNPSFGISINIGGGGGGGRSYSGGHGGHGAVTHGGGHMAPGVGGAKIVGGGGHGGGRAPHAASHGGGSAAHGGGAASHGGGRAPQTASHGGGGASHAGGGQHEKK